MHPRFCNDWLRLRNEPFHGNWGDGAALWARSIYQQCEAGDANHMACRKVIKRMDAQRPCYYTDNTHQQSYPFLPTRLIDVGGDSIRIVSLKQFLDNENPKYVPKYTALSYCWGDDATPLQLRLTEQNKYSLRKEITQDMLSAAQRDAVKVTRAMGFRYLWIDALCIIQDNTKDWEREAADMGKVYQYAALTIVSLMSNSQETFSNFHPSLRSPFYIPFESKIGRSPDGRLLRGRYQLWFDGVENKFGGPVLLNKISKALPSNRWVTRGWTFQEQNHSLRMLILWDKGVRFNCPYHSTPFLYQLNTNYGDISTHYWWSRDDEGSVGTYPDEDSFNHSHTVVRDIYSHSSWRKQFLYYTWLRFATDYSLRVFGRESDVFPALWATASLYKSRLQDEYMMGIWKNDLWGFLWRCGANGSSVPYDDLGTLVAEYETNLQSRVGAMASWSWLGKRSVKFLHQTGDICDDLDLDDFRNECELDTFELKPRDGDHAKGYDCTNLWFQAKATEDATGYQNARAGDFENEATISLRTWGDRVTCMLDTTGFQWHNNGTCEFSTFYRTRFMLLASVGVKGRYDGQRAAVGLILGGPSITNRRGPTKAWFRCGVFVSKPVDGIANTGLDVFGNLEKENVWVK